MTEPKRSFRLKRLDRPQESMEELNERIAEILAEGFCRYTVYRMAERGELPGAKIARRWRFSETDLHAWLEQQKPARASPRRQRPSGSTRKANTR